MNQVAVIIAARGACEQISDCLESLCTQTFRPSEIVVVDDGLTPQAQAAVACFSAQAVCVKNVGNGASAARNHGVKVTKSPLAMFMDADCVAAPDLLERLVKGLSSGDHVACGGRQCVPADATAFECDVYRFMGVVGGMTDYMRKAKTDIEAVEHNASCNVLYRRDAFGSVGGFTEGLWPGEDVDLDRRLVLAGKTLCSDPQAIVYHHRPKDMKGFLRMMSRYGWSQGMLLRCFGAFRLLHWAAFGYIALECVLLVVLFVSWKITLAIVLAMLLAALVAACGRLRVWAMIVLGVKTWKIGFVKGALFPDRALLAVMRGKSRSV